MNLFDDTSTTAQETESLLRLIREQSAAEVTQLRARTEEHLQHIRAAAASEAESFRTAARSQGEERGRREAAKLLARAEAESHRQILWARESLIEEVLGQARQQLAALPGEPGAAEIFARLVREALLVLPAGTVRVRVPASCASFVDRLIAEGAGEHALTAVVDPTVPDGAIIETDDARLCFDNTVDARIRRRMPQLRRLIVEALLSEEGAAR